MSRDCGWLVSTPVVERSLSSNSSSASASPLAALFSASDSCDAEAEPFRALPPFLAAAFFFLESEGLWVGRAA